MIIWTAWSLNSGAYFECLPTIDVASRLKGVYTAFSLSAILGEAHLPDLPDLPQAKHRDCVTPNWVNSK